MTLAAISRMRAGVAVLCSSTASEHGESTGGAFQGASTTNVVLALNQ
jgi:hypothetical protein